MKWKILAALSIVFCLTTLPAKPVLAEGDDVGRLPTSWYLLPEDQPDTLDAHSKTEDHLSQPAKDTLDILLKTNARVLDNVVESESASTVFQNQSQSEPWKLAACMFDLSVSAQGAIGLLVAKGEATATLAWRRKAPALEDTPTMASEQEAAALNFSDVSTQDQLATKLEPIIQTVMATGRVKDEGILRRGLYEAAKDFKDLIGGLILKPGPVWAVSRLRLDFSIDGSGKVYPGTTVGGGVRLRFEWDPTPVTAALVHQDNMADGQERRENLRRFLQNLAADLSTMPYDEMAPTGYELKSMRIGLGIFGEGKFGVGKIGGVLMGYIYFSKQAQASLSSSLVETEDTIPVVDSNPKEEHLSLARKLGIRVIPAPGPGQEWRRVVYMVPREAFRKGLEKANRITIAIAERAANIGSEKWDLYQIKTEFALSLSGTAGLVTLGGTGALELVSVKTTQTN